MKWIFAFLDFLFPQRCVGCHVVGELLCNPCLSQLSMQPNPFVHEASWILDGLFVITPYEKGSLLQTCIKTMKYRHTPELANRLGEWMGSYVPLMQFCGYELVPVPLHSQRERERGYNQAHRLAEGVATVLSLPIFEPLERCHFTAPQAQLSREDRLKNLRNSFSLKQSFTVVNKKIVLVDDVCSTGATLNECARALKAGGAATVWGLVLARGA